MSLEKPGKPPTELALEFMEIFYASGDLDELYRLLAPDLVFEGPFARYNSARDYVEALHADPPDDVECRIIRIFDGGDSANVLYEFTRGDITTPMSQMFEVEDGRIKKILLIFDSAAFL